MAVSQNGWSVISWPGKSRVPGTSVDLTVRQGAAGRILLWVASQFDRRVEDIDNASGHIDDGAWNNRPVRGSTSISNHASGTAIDLNWSRHPLGARGTFTAAQAREIRAILAEIPHRVVRWGGDYVNRADEMHFEINASASLVSDAWNQLSKPTTRPAPQEDDMPFGISKQLRVGLGQRTLINVPRIVNDQHFGELSLAVDGGTIRFSCAWQGDNDDKNTWHPLWGPDWNNPQHVDRVVKSGEPASRHRAWLGIGQSKIRFDVEEVVAPDPAKLSADLGLYFDRR